MGSLAISAPRGGPAPLRHRGDSFPRIMAVGGVFLIFEVIRTASGPGAESTGETSGTEPESGRRRSDAAAVRQSMRRRHRRAPRRLEPPCGPRAARQPRTGAVGAVAVRSARTASRGSERSALTPSTRHVRRSTAPEWLAGCNGCFMLCERRGVGPRGGRYRQLASTRRPASTASVLW